MEQHNNKSRKLEILNNFDSLIDNLNQQKNALSDYLQMQEGGRYELKLIPDSGLQKLNQLFAKFNRVQFISKKNGKKINYISPRSLGRFAKDYALDYRSKAWQQDNAAFGKDHARENEIYKSIELYQLCKIRVYVISDSINPANNGQVKIWAMPTSIANKLMPTKVPESDKVHYADFIRKKKKIVELFSFDEKSRSLIVSIDKKGQFRTYAHEFSDIQDFNISDEAFNLISDYAHNPAQSLVNLHKIATSEEVESLFREHYLLETGLNSTNNQS